MKRSVILVNLILFCFLLIIVSSFGDERSEPKDLIVALDKSLSMEDKIDEVKLFLISDIIDGLIKDDFFLLLTFYGTTEVATAKYISDPAKDIPALKKDVEKILANGPYTDIGNVLDRLKDEFFERAGNNRKKWCFLVTDGIHEPKRGSKYYSTDGSFSHEFLDDLKEIKNLHGWKVQFLEIGQGSAREMAQSLGVDYVQIDDEVTAEDIGTIIDDPYVTISIIQETIQAIKVNNKNRGKLKFNLKTDGMKKETEIIVSGLQLQSSALTIENILDSDSGTPFSLTLPGEDIQTEVEIPVKIESNLSPGDYKTEIFFAFLSSEHFDEDGISVRVHINNFFQNHWWALPLLILAIIGLIGIIILLGVSLAQGKGYSFKIIVDEAPIPDEKNHFKVNRKKELYMNESLDMISMVAKKTRKSVAKITYLPEGIHLQPLNEFRFENVADIPHNIIDQTVCLRTLSSKLFKITFKSIT